MIWKKILKTIYLIHADLEPSFAYIQKLGEDEDARLKIQI
jgi:hypothetical protein